MWKTFASIDLASLGWNNKLKWLGHSYARQFFFSSSSCEFKHKFVCRHSMRNVLSFYEAKYRYEWVCCVFCCDLKLDWHYVYECARFHLATIKMRCIAKFKNRFKFKYMLCALDVFFSSCFLISFNAQCFYALASIQSTLTHF